MWGLTGVCERREVGEALRDDWTAMDEQQRDESNDDGWGRGRNNDGVGYVAFYFNPPNPKRSNMKTHANIFRPSRSDSMWLRLR